MSSNDKVRESPNEKLAGQIARELSKAGLIPENRSGDLEAKLKFGGVSQDDWNLWVDLATAPDRQKGTEDE